MAISIQNIWFSKINFKQQEQLVNKEKLAAVGGMADGLAHQIKNRLNTFSLIGASMKLEFDLWPKYTRYMEEVDEYLHSRYDPSNPNQCGPINRSTDFNGILNYRHINK